MKKTTIAVMLAMSASFANAENIDMRMALCSVLVEKFESLERSIPFVTWLVQNKTKSGAYITGVMDESEAILKSNPNLAWKAYKNTCKEVSAVLNND